MLVQLLLAGKLNDAVVSNHAQPSHCCCCKNPDGDFCIAVTVEILEEICLQVYNAFKMFPFLFIFQIIILL